MSVSALWEPVTPSSDSVVVTPAGGISSTDLQSALEELDTEKQANTGLAAARIAQDIQVFEYLTYGAM